MYLSSIHLQNFRGIKDLTVSFDSRLNVIIGPNGAHKTALIDAIRLFYSWGNQTRDFDISKEDFYKEVIDVAGNPVDQIADTIKLDYVFDDLSIKQQGVFYAYLYKDDLGIHARVTITYTESAKGRIVASYTTGNPDSGQKADPRTF